MTPPDIFWLDAAAGPPPEASVALLAGYSAFTTFRWPLPARRFAAHLARLAENAAAMGFSCSFEREAIANALSQRFASPVVARLTACPATLALADLWEGSARDARLLVCARPAPPLSSVASCASLALQSVSYRKAFAEIKHGALAEGFLLRRRARAAGFDDALWRRDDGCATEATTANLFWLGNDAIWTPHPRQDGCLPGVTRAEVLEIAGAMGVAAHERALAPEEEASLSVGAFLTNAVSGLTPIHRLDDRTLPWSDAARRLFSALQARYNAETDTPAETPPV